MARRNQPTISAYSTWRRGVDCACGCGFQVTGKKIYFDTKCRKRRQRYIEKAEKVLGPNWEPALITGHNSRVNFDFERGLIGKRERNNRLIHQSLTRTKF